MIFSMNDGTIPSDGAIIVEPSSHLMTIGVPTNGTVGGSGRTNVVLFSGVTGVSTGPAEFC